MLFYFCQFLLAHTVVSLSAPSPKGFSASTISQSLPSQAPSTIQISKPSSSLPPTAGLSTAPTKLRSTLPSSNSPSKKPTATFSPTKISVQPTLAPVKTIQSSAAPSLSPTSLERISYHHNGSIIVSPQLYNVYIGHFSKSTMDLIDFFAANIGSSSNSPDWYSTVQTYYQIQGGKLTRPNRPVFKARWTLLPTARALNLNDEYLANLLSSLIIENGLQSCTNCIYNIIFNGGFTFSGWNDPSSPDGFCGYHTVYDYSASGSSFQAQVTVIGDPATASPVNVDCIATYPTVNGDLSADSIVSIYAHEIVNAITDSHGDAWYANSDSFEVADMCNFDFGTLQNWNYLIGGKEFLVQLLWQNGVGCVYSSHVAPSTIPTTRPFSKPSTVSTTKTPSSLPASTRIPTTTPSSTSTKSTGLTPSQHPTLSPKL